MDYLLMSLFKFEKVIWELIHGIYYIVVNNK